MLSSVFQVVALLLAAQSCHAGGRAHGGHGGPPEAYRHVTPQWPHSYVNATSVGFAASAATAASVSATNTAANGGIINAVDATLKFWWPSRASQAASTIQILYNTNDTSTGWTIYPATNTLNIDYAVTTEVCSPPTVTITYSDLTFTPSNCDTKIPQVAADTSGVYLNAFKTPNVTTGYMTPIPDLRTVTPAAVATIGSTTIQSGTPFVEFTKYEVVSCRATTNCQTSTYDLSVPYAFEYTGPDPAKAKNVTAVMTGKLDPAFPSYINRTSLAAGEWSGPSTVIVVVNIILVAVAVLAATIEQSATRLIEPTPILPPGFSRLPPATTTIIGKPQPATARIERTETYLLVPDAPTTTIAITKQSAVITFPAVTTTCNLDCPAPSQNIVLDGTTLTPTTAQLYVANGKTLYIGQSASVSDCEITVPTAGTILQKCGSTTLTLQLPAAGLVTVDGITISAATTAGYLISGNTLVAGGPGTTIGGLPVWLASGRGGLQIGKATQTVVSTQTVASTTTATAHADTTSNDVAPTTTSSTNSALAQSAVSSTFALAACAILSYLWVVG